MSFDLNVLVQAAFYVSLNLTKALTAFIQRDSVLYWPFALSALLVAIAVAYVAHVKSGGMSFRAALRSGLSSKLWWNASTRADYRLYVANALVLPALFAFVLFSDKHVVRWLEGAFGGAAST